AYFCNLSTTRTPVYITVEPIPVLTISGSTTGNDFVKLTASGGVYYSWSGGYSPTTATNTFTNSSTYMVTVTNAEGCSDNASGTVTVNKYGVTENGQLVSDVMKQLSRNGQPNATSFVNKHGKSSSSVPTDGQLNFSVFGTGSACAANAGDLTNLTVPVNQTSSGTKSANALLDWSSWNVLSAAGVSVPNGGDYFAVAASGYFVPEETGNYTFTCEGDDAVDLFINNINVANHYGCHGIAGLGSHIGTIYLEQGTRYSFRARMQENGGGEGIRVFWRKPSESSGWNVYPSEITSN
ncbi:MAG: PA14 domain-containing protein, partial [Chitinophagales bacterium]